jgi:hypothetical protein
MEVSDQLYPRGKTPLYPIDAVAKKKILTPVRNQTPDVQPIA